VKQGGVQKCMPGGCYGVRVGGEGGCIAGIACALPLFITEEVWRGWLWCLSAIKCSCMPAEGDRLICGGAGRRASTAVRFPRTFQAT
jgi:hypothetical protein